MNDELVVTSPNDTASECFALVYNRSCDALFLSNVEAVIAVGSLTSEQYCHLASEFKKRYTETKAKMKHVVFVLEQTVYARCLSDIPESVPRYTIDDLHKQNESISGDLKIIVEALVASINNKFEKDDGYSRKNVKEPVVTSSTNTTGVGGTQKKRTKSGTRQSPPAPTKGHVHLALLALLQEDEKAKYKTAEELAEIVRKKYKTKKCSVSAVKATLAWQRDYDSSRRRVNAVLVEDADKLVDTNARHLNSLNDTCQDLDDQT